MTVPNSGPTHEIVERKVGDLWIDPQVQRTLKASRVKGIAADFDPNAVGVLTTSYRSPKRIHIIDGMHRYNAMQVVQYSGVFRTLEYHGLTVQQEAALFRKLNNTEKVSKTDQFLIACVEKDPDALRLAGFLRAHGWTVASGSAEGRIAAVGSLRRVYALSPEATDSALAVLTAAFGHQPLAVQGPLIEGLGKMLARYENVKPPIDLNNLAARMSGFPGGPDGIVGNARGQMLTRTGNLSKAVAVVLTRLYNERRRSTNLPDFT